MKVDVLEDVQLVSVTTAPQPEAGGWAGLFRVRHEGRELEVFGVGVVRAAEVVGHVGVLALFDVKLGKPLYTFDSYQDEGREVANAMTWWAGLPRSKRAEVRKRKMDRGLVGQILAAYKAGQKGGAK